MDNDVPKTEAQLAEQSGLTQKDIFELYESGKHRRYGLLFSVNGGAFAIATLLVGSPGRPAAKIGDLDVSTIAYGMMAITTIMTFDIFMFGMKMRFVRDKVQSDKVFGWLGCIVLVAIWAVLFLGWRWAATS